MGGGTLLLVDDDELLRDSACELIGLLGFTVLTAKDGVEALEVFRQHQAEIRCVLTDLTMPRLDGWGLLAALRQLDPNLPVILASGYDKAQVLAGNHADRPQAFLSKPFDLQQLRAALAQTLLATRSGGL
jgi:CheY-like chemotaxis protein